MLRGRLSRRLDRAIRPVNPAGELGVQLGGDELPAPREEALSPSDLLSADLDRFAATASTRRRRSLPQRDEPTPRAPGVTVVVATRDRPDALRRCLDALDRQTCDVEVVVVDDGSTDAGPVAAAVDAFPRARLLRSDGRGPAAARNAGAAVARAPLVCFTDDDCEPAGDWAELMAARLRGNADAAAGRTVVADRSDRVAIAAQAIADHLAGSARRADGTIAFSPSSSLGCRLAVVLAVPFDESYPRPGGEDRDWCARLVAAGYRFVAAPEAVVLHRPSLTAWSFWRRQVYYGRCSSRFRRTSPGVRPMEAPRFYAALVRRGFEQGPTVGVLVVAAQFAALIGTAADRLSALRQATRSAGAAPRRAS